MGPFQARVERLILVFGDADDEAIHLRLKPDLAAEPARGPHVEGEIKHVFFHWGGRARLFHPTFVDVHMARRTAACAAAFCYNARHCMLDRRFHHGLARLALGREDRSVVFYISDFDHMVPPDCSKGPTSKAAGPEIQSRNSPGPVAPTPYARQNCIKSPKSYGSVPEVQRLLMKWRRIAIFISPNRDLRLWRPVDGFIFGVGQSFFGLKNPVAKAQDGFIGGAVWARV
jgi:hypothetical protein